MTKKTKILAVVGPTASGKSALALELCRQLDGELISCDSMQVYRKMDIGTAKPTKAEQLDVRHHLIDIVDAHDEFSCAEFVTAAVAAIDDCVSRGKLPIVCGGTGLYLDALLRGSEFEDAGADEAIRADLAAYAEKEGNEALHARLALVDPESASAIHPNNVKRVIRALEIYQTSGVTKTEWDRRSQAVEPRYDATVVGLCYPDRTVLYDRIDRRVDVMIEQGLVEETKTLMSDGVFVHNKGAAQAIGYKELIPYIEGRVSLCEAVDQLKMATRRYAKRQMTWFVAKPYVQWLENDGTKTFEEIVNYAKSLFSPS